MSEDRNETFEIAIVLSGRRNVCWFAVKEEVNSCCSRSGLCHVVRWCHIVCGPRVLLLLLLLFSFSFSLWLELVRESSSTTSYMRISGEILRKKWQQRVHCSCVLLPLVILVERFFFVCSHWSSCLHLKRTLVSWSATDRRVEFFLSPYFPRISRKETNGWCRGFVVAEG